MSNLDENQIVNDNRILGYQVNGKPSAITPILQFNETTKSFDWIESSSSDGMSDLEFIQAKVLTGDYFQLSGDINTLADVISYTPETGKTAFLIEAKIINPTHPVPSAESATSGDTQFSIVSAALKIDGTIKDKTTIGEATRSIVSSSNQQGGGSGSGYGNMGDGKFNVIGLSLVGDDATLIEIENILDDGLAFATMSGYLVDTV